MDKQIRWRRSLGVRLGGAVAVVSVAALVLVALNLLLLGKLHGEEIWTTNLAEGIVLRYEVLDLSERLFAVPAQADVLEAEAEIAQKRPDHQPQMRIPVGDQDAEIFIRCRHGVKIGFGIWR